jgi:hypothetical protein
MRAFDWRFLPYPGGLMDQPDDVIRGVLTIEDQYNKTKEKYKNGAVPIAARRYVRKR